MKTLLVIGSMLLSAASYAQKIDAANVPAAVKTSFAKNFPGTNDAKWEMEKGSYEANFKQKGKTTSALFSAVGSWLETETDITVSELTAAVISYITANYKNEKIKEAAKLKMANGDTNYEAEVKGTDLIFDANGKFIKAAKA